MNSEYKSLQIGTIVIVSALILRILAGGILDKMAHFFMQPEVTAALIFVETGRIVSVPRAEDPTPIPDVPEETTAPEQAVSPTVLSFSEKDSQLVTINNACGLSVDIPSLLQSPLTWDLTGKEPKVLILHTHASESYANTADSDTPYRSRNETENMLAIGDLVAQRLEKAGIGVIHDRSIHDYPSYNGSYNSSRKQTNAYLKQYPSICLVLDLHRDAMENADGKQIGTSLTVNGKKTAQLMMVVGTNAGGLNHPNWQQNMALAVKLHAQLEKLYPGICRAISFRKQRFNQDLSTGAMLIEVGAAGNTPEEAKNAAALLADGIIALAKGSQ